ncbi:methyl-accepting chemotaxis protein [Aquabacterium sp. J223]|uniref:methyl-accepting chemotaxis protein n=1 Tax=Aquabacterium sp. J223 TaxID=2898431 RepID=UPI0021AD55A8|nr:methyl-accepting chemotaxis protein [Aquabacterium sp. J223]UUX94306.1 methyl-accepting chemotaxis protein [Aquabacterium sp. J223]
MSLRHLTIGRKLALSFGLLAALVLLVATASILSLGTEHRHFSAYVQETGARITLARDLLDRANARAIGARNLVLLRDAADRERERQVVVRDHERVQVTLKKLKDAVAGASSALEEERRLVADLETLESQYAPVALKVVELATSGALDEAATVMNTQCRPLLAKLVTSAQAYADLGAQKAAAEVAAGDDAFRTNLVLMLACGVAALAVAIVLGIVIHRAVVGPIRQAVSVAQAVAAGDLTSAIEVGRRDEMGALLVALKAMNDGLVDIVGQVRSSSDHIAIGSAEIASGNADLSQRTELQASSLQQTASSMEQMQATVHHNAQTASRAAQLASAVSTAASEGGETVRRVVTTMEGISLSSRKIADIIGVIDGIAFQTNILALNAAVEAARAGEQGRGFSVVASEVRSLAQRSAEAAREIKDLIGSSVEQVEAGSVLVGDAGKAMDELVAQVRRVADLIGEMDGATREQTQGIQQVGRAVADIDQVTQQNAALVEQSAAAAENLSKQAVRLASVVSVFRVA